jgi:tRNA pseudouridine38-40 synthase
MKMADSESNFSNQLSMRYFFEISYAGTHYHGWQNQANATGVQQVVENALSKILREKINITGSGRTDTGVHCLQQFFHADIESEVDKDSFLIRLNSFLPKDIAIKNFFAVRPEAHARYDARERTYVYSITRKKNPFLSGQSYYFFRDIDIPAMNRAAEALIGKHDFESFSKVKTEVNHFECTITKAIWKEQKDILTFTISANRFLRGMVRAIVGTLLDVGSGRTTMSQFREILQSKDRKNAGSNVPPEGLSLVKVTYSKKIYL